MQRASPSPLISRSLPSRHNASRPYTDVGAALAEAPLLCRAVLSQRVFGGLYAATKYWTLLPASARARLLQILGDAVADLLSEIADPAAIRAADPAAAEPARMQALARNGYKAAVYLFAVLVEVAEKTTAATAAAASAARSSSKGGASKVCLLCLQL